MYVLLRKRIFTFRIRSQMFTVFPKFLPAKRPCHDACTLGIPQKEWAESDIPEWITKEHQQSSIHPRLTQLCALHQIPIFKSAGEVNLGELLGHWGNTCRIHPSTFHFWKGFWLVYTSDQRIFGVDSKMNDVIRTDSANNNRRRIKRRLSHQVKQNKIDEEPTDPRRTATLLGQRSWAADAMAANQCLTNQSHAGKHQKGLAWREKICKYWKFVFFCI